MTTSSFSGVHVEPNLGPLTSIWTPPTSCLNTATFYGGDDFAGPGMRGLAVAPECYPDGFATDTVYSPGVCPSGWGYKGEPETGQGWTTTFPSSLTVRQCCPGTMVPWEGEGWMWCTGGLPSSTLYTFWSTASDATYGSWLTTSWTTDGQVYAKPVFAAYQATDTEIFTLLPANERPSITSSSPSPGASSTMAPTKTSTSTPTPTNNGGGGGLSSGAKAGIGVGVTLGVILIALIAGFWFWQYRRHKNTRDSTGFEPNRNAIEQSEYSGQSPSYGYQSPEPYHSPEPYQSPDPSYSGYYAGAKQQHVAGPQQMYELQGAGGHEPLELDNSRRG